jgi:hypothetical protein
MHAASVGIPVPACHAGGVLGALLAWCLQNNSTLAWRISTTENSG